MFRITVNKPGKVVKFGANIWKTPFEINVSEEAWVKLAQKLKAMEIPFSVEQYAEGDDLLEAKFSIPPVVEEINLPPVHDPVVEVVVVDTVEVVDEEPTIEIPEEPVVEATDDLPDEDIPEAELDEPALEVYAHEDTYVLNYRKDLGDPRDFQAKAVLLEADETPAATVNYQSEMSPVKNQGQLGSCVGFAVAAMKEWQEKKEHEGELSKGKRGRKKVYNYSEQWIYYKCKENDPWPNEEGTSLRVAMDVLQKQGVPTEKAWPYDDIEIGEPKNWAPMIAKWALGGSYYRIVTPEQVIQTLHENGPCVVGILCFREIFYPETGVVAYPADPSNWYGGHAVCIVGWNAKTRMFRFKNSWGTGWGTKGYGLLPYDYIRDFMLDGWVMKDITVTREMLKS